jgi:hypothetical protein
MRADDLGVSVACAAVNLKLPSDGMWINYGFVPSSAVRVRFEPRGASPITIARLPLVGGFAKRFYVVYLKTHAEVPTALVALDAAGHEVTRI